MSELSTDLERNGETMTFQDLDEDSLFEILKYLPLEERSPFEFMSKTWALALNRVWNSERVLCFDNKSIDCYVKRLRLNFAEHFGPKMTSNLFLIIMVRITSRCPNLRALRFPRKEMSTEECVEMGRKLSQICPHLEHVSNASPAFIKSYTEHVQDVNISSLHLMGEDYSLIKLCPKLVTMSMSVQPFYFTEGPEVEDQSVDKLDIERLLHLNLKAYSSLPVQLISKAINLTTLYINNLLISLRVDEVQILAHNLLKLQKLTLYQVSLKAIRYFAGHRYLTRIGWHCNEYEVPGHELLEYDQSLVCFWKGRGSLLMCMDITCTTLSKTPSLVFLAELCPNLVTLKIHNKSQSMRIPISLSQMMYLKKLSLVQVMVTEDDVQELMTRKSHHIMRLTLDSCQMMVNPWRLISLVRNCRLTILRPNNLSLNVWKKGSQTKELVNSLALKFQLNLTIN